MSKGIYKRKPWSDARKHQRSIAFRGHSVSDLFRAKTSARMKAHPNKNFEGSQRGKKWSEERRKEWSKLQTGKKRSPHTIESRKRMSEIARMRSRKTMDESKIARKGFDYKIWRQSVYLRDNYTCLKCQNRGGILHPHHIVNFSSCAELRYDVINGSTLCVACHKLFHKKYGKKNNNRFQFDAFLSGGTTFHEAIKQDGFCAMLPEKAGV